MSRRERRRLLRDFSRAELIFATQSFMHVFFTFHARRFTMHSGFVKASTAAFFASALFVFFSTAAFSADAPKNLPKVPAELEKVRAALEKYQDPVRAVHDGYFSTLACVAYSRPGRSGEVPAYAQAGAMGIHFLNPAAIGPTPDPARPQVLLYEPAGGKLRLVGAEWLIPLATGVKERPTLFGRAFDGPMDGHEPTMTKELRHYDLHVWLWKENPAGLFSPTNPNVKCGEYGYAFVEEPPALIER
jgi:hypothetical protein